MSTYPITAYWRPSSDSSFQPDAEEDSGLQTETIAPPVRDHYWSPQPSPFHLLKTFESAGDENLVYDIDPSNKPDDDDDDDDDDEVLVDEDDKYNPEGCEIPPQYKDLPLKAQGVDAGNGNFAPIES